MQVLTGNLQTRSVKLLYAIIEMTESVWASKMVHCEILFSLPSCVSPYHVPYRAYITHDSSSLLITHGSFDKGRRQARKLKYGPLINSIHCHLIRFFNITRWICVEMVPCYQNDIVSCFICSGVSFAIVKCFQSYEIGGLQIGLVIFCIRVGNSHRHIIMSYYMVILNVYCSAMKRSHALQKFVFYTWKYLINYSNQYLLWCTVHRLILF